MARWGRSRPGATSGVEVLWLRSLLGRWRPGAPSSDCGIGAQLLCSRSRSRPRQREGWPMMQSFSTLASFGATDDGRPAGHSQHREVHPDRRTAVVRHRRPDAAALLTGSGTSRWHAEPAPPSPELAAVRRAATLVRTPSCNRPPRTCRECESPDPHGRRRGKGAPKPRPGSLHPQAGGRIDRRYLECQQCPDHFD